jgi:hypothetical protein
MSKKLTIVAVAAAQHKLTSRAVDQAVKVTGANNVLVLSDQDLYPGATWVKTEAITQQQYNKIVFNELAEHITTDHFMIVQYDGMPVDTTHWDEDYLNCDYIGAVWPWLPEGMNVGNGGFSIRSRKLAEACKDLEFGPAAMIDDQYAEDVNICRYYRQELEARSITFAASNLARKFSAEIPGGRFATYGFHGTLCLPYYLDDDHMSFYIDNMTEQMLTSASQSRILLGLIAAERFDHVEQMMDKGSELVTDFKDLVARQADTERHYFPNLDSVYIEEMFVNY